ncbi:hypothetical protein BSLG_002657 [Batrachochytrium salamandrivorans]|nr:hypothetical protein BSLG_003319 [Batrachochytrium salamandrivorans]KAJ1342838.1 hypothetical protein BSLG_002657 [Batrachochytrium salamandrivorans]
MSVAGITAENAENFEDIEKQWAVKSFHHAETYFKLVSSVPARQVKLTPIDDEIYTAFRGEFPDLNVGVLKELEDFKTEKAKAKWRDFIMNIVIQLSPNCHPIVIQLPPPRYEKKVQDFNFGTLLRNRSGEDYAQDNCFFVTRFQFLAIEIARNREGNNDALCNK